MGLILGQFILMLTISGMQASLSSMNFPEIELRLRDLTEDAVEEWVLLFLSSELAFIRNHNRLLENSNDGRNEPLIDEARLVVQI